MRCPAQHVGWAPRERPAPRRIMAAAQEAAQRLGSPYLTVDLAEGEAGWIALEVGDGGVSGPAPFQDLEAHWTALAQCFRGGPRPLGVESTATLCG